MAFFDQITRPGLSGTDEERNPISAYNPKAIFPRTNRDETPTQARNIDFTRLPAEISKRADAIIQDPNSLVPQQNRVTESAPQPNYTSQEVIDTALARSREFTANLAQGTAALGQQMEQATTQKPAVSTADSQLVRDAQQYINVNNTQRDAPQISEATSATREGLPYPQQEHIENYKPTDPKLITDIEDHLKFRRQNTGEPTSSPDGVWRIPETRKSGENFASLFPAVPETSREPILATQEDSPIPENFPKNKATPLPQRLWGAFKKAMATAAIAGTLLLNQDSGPVAKTVDITPAQPENPPVLIQEPTIHDIPPLILHQAGIAPTETPQRPTNEPSTIAISTPVNTSLERAPTLLIPPPISEGQVPSTTISTTAPEQTIIPNAPPKTGGGFAAQTQEAPSNMAKKPSFWQRLFGGK